MMMPTRKSLCKFAYSTSIVHASELITSNSARNELSMYFRTSQIMLHHKFLLYHSQTLSTNDPQHVRNINQGRTCVMAASTAISSISDRMETLQTTILTWLSAYTVFLSAVTLLVATIALDTSDIYSQHTIEHTIRVAVQILKHATYGAGQNRFPYLNFLLVSYMPFQTCYLPRLTLSRPFPQKQIPNSKACFAVISLCLRQVTALADLKAHESRVLFSALRSHIPNKY